MKKFIALLLVAVMCLPLMACNNESGNTETPPSGESTDNEPPANDNNKLEKKYQRVVKWAENPSHCLADDNGNGMSHNETCKYIYDLLTELGDYKDSADYLAKFMVIPNALTKITYTETDNFGQTTDYTDKTYEYNKNGECADLSYLFNLIELSNVGVYDHYDYEYDENNRISGIHITAGFYNMTVCKVKFDYDDNGNIVNATIQTADETYTNTYTYDEHNRLLTSDVLALPWVHGDSIEFDFSTEPFHCEGYNARYEYDENGNLTKVFQTPYRLRNNPESLNTDYCRVVEYTYDQNRFLIQTKTTSYNRDGEIDNELKVYTNDEHGNILSVEKTKDGETTVYTYHYETQYIYTGEN